jgi:hypothetical protein
VSRLATLQAYLIVKDTAGFLTDAAILNGSKGAER